MMVDASIGQALLPPLIRRSLNRSEQEKQLWTKDSQAELEPLRHYVLAEDYHQDYLKKILVATAISMSMMPTSPGLIRRTAQNPTEAQTKK